MQKSISSSAGLPASHFPLPAFERELLTLEEISPSRISQLLTVTDRNGLSGKTYRAFFLPTPALKRRVIWKMGKNGKPKKRVISDASSPVFRKSGMGSPTAFLTLNFVEWTGILGLCRSAEGVSSLSEILETGVVLRRYYLSPRACSGILRRAEKRNKTLPEQLRVALERVAASATTTSPSRLSVAITPPAQSMSQPL
jgi:hypothetical protein